MHPIKSTEQHLWLKGSRKSRFRVVLLTNATIVLFITGCLFSATKTPIVPTTGPGSQTASLPTTLPATQTLEQPTFLPVLETTQPVPYLSATALPVLTKTPTPESLSTKEGPGLPTVSVTPQSSPTSTTMSFESIPEPLMGVEAQSMRPSVLTAFQNAGFQWTRRNALLWSVVEPLEGQRNWVAVASIERDLSTAASQGIKTILIIRDTPLWAQKVYGHSCGAVKPDKLGVFAVFMKDLVARYSVPPFNVKYWEIGNEPDVDPSLVDADSLFGCWGDLSDPYYGGGYYAEMLKVVYPAIKSADPQANVLNGGLLLDCDPSNPPAGKDCKSALFLKGMLEAGAADYFDILSYHGYPYYHGSWETVETAGTWRARGGYVMGKLAYLREILNAYGVQKPIFLTEGSLTCPEWNTGFCTPPGEAFFEMQGDYAVMLYVRNWAAGISGTFWYGLEGPGWRYTSMLDGGQNPKPDYLALSFLLSELKGAVYRREVFEYENVRGYEFALPDKHVWVLWPKDDNPHHILLPFDALKVYDRAGKAIALASTGVELAHPIYIEFNP